jgi:hypothetical protein
LRYRRPFWRYDGQPILAGRITEGNRGTRLDLRYRAPLPMYVFYPLFYFFLLFFASTLFLFGQWEPTISLAEKGLVAGFLIFMTAFPLGMHFAFTARADAEFDEIIAFLEQEVQARIETTAGAAEHAKLGW